MRHPRTDLAIDLLEGFAERTGLASDAESDASTDGAGRRYLWTDAFAVCTLLGLWRSTGDGDHRELALTLIDRVHHVLGRHRPDDARTGWISGLADEDGEAHPTAGGLRIGKPLPERATHDRFDERLEWDRDGQYFHYLTKWMHALAQTRRATGQPLFDSWARDLALAAHRAFVYAPRDVAPKRMYWKMSIDLSRPLVASMGHHDPLDGLVTCIELDATARPAPPTLERAAADYAAMLVPSALATSDPLGLGGLLADAALLRQLAAEGVATPDGLLEALLAAAARGLRSYLEQPDLRAPASRRLAFRELGLATGIAALPVVARDASGLGREARADLDRLERFVPVQAQIESFWSRPEHRDTEIWREHQDINDVMLAAALVPEGFLVLQPRAAAP